jgi:alkylation response protein AidB-like acyl-CoA dehydrogenase
VDFALSAEQEELRRTLRSFFEREAPVSVVSGWDRDEHFPEDVWERMAALGLCGIAIDEAYGGNPLDEISICLVAEEMSRASAALIYAYIPTTTFGARGIGRFGTEEQRRRILPEVAAGRLRLAQGLSEPDVGSDLTHLSTRATRDGDDFVVRGQKIFCTGADTAGYILTFVRTDPESTGHSGLSVLLIPRTAPGVTVRPLPKLAGQATHTCEVFLDDVRVPCTELVGSLGGGARIVFSLLDAERIYVGAQGCGLAQGALDLALSHARQRVQFGVPIIEHQAVGHMLADMALDVEQARLMVWRAAWKLDRGLPASMDASLAKVAGSECGTRCALRGMQVLGGYSYMLEYGMERYLRECKLWEIAGGTNQIQRNIIAKHLGRNGTGG